MTLKSSRIWFPAKTYGYGWGPPTCWQGWAVVGVFIILVGASAAILLPGKHMGAFIGCVVALSLGLTGVCWLKGERPGWRWGRNQPAKRL